MIEIQEKNIDDVLQSAQKQAIQQSVPAFVSVTEQIEPIDPIVFFHAGSEFSNDRIFWSNADQQVELVGIGQAIYYQDQAASYQAVKKQWLEAIQNSFIVNSFDNVKTGPIAFAGFPFDPEEQTKELWAKFAGSQLIVPTFLLTIEKGQYFVTTTTQVTHDSELDDLLKQLTEQKQQLLQSTQFPPKENQIILQHEVDPQQWKEMVQKATEEIAAEHVHKVVLARELQVEFSHSCSIAEIIAALKEVQDNNYVFAWEKDRTCFIGATPERLVKVDNNHVYSTCLAGTAPRGKTKREDRHLGEELLNDKKNLEEHQFVVDMIRKSVHSFAKYVNIPDKPVLYPLKNLQHLYTPVKAVLEEDYTIVDIIEKLHPTPALCGFPRHNSLAFIRQFEQMERGWYGAPIGWMDSRFNGEFAVAIRSALVDDTHASLFAGCGVLRDSDPHGEYQETAIKFTPMLDALGGWL
ncbi:isochorismate synthase [Gracilibacillus alcaliphilus]|uniref:isochorismate synthase n=1 Tax=Gracilibacillus alcaliphilus TaxID=1401441 RepID=UPI00195A8876|nr:isochorismate synthase [Gracilibacillus alcaliphilus]MBM7675858.1 menaquinone-specific isochorismate synthase [Gracilibacillus alcaliphilus]